MSEPIKPALTPEEWAGATHRDPAVYPMATDPRWLQEVIDGYMSMYADEPAHHKTAAVALHGQPFGFTWADVDMLREEVEPCGCRQTASAAEDAEVMCVFRALEALADRIAALLPPREGEG